MSQTDALLVGGVTCNYSAKLNTAQLEYKV